MIMATVYLFLSILGAMCSLYLSALTFSTALRTGSVQTAAGRVYDREVNPFAFYGILVTWTLITAMMIVCVIVLLEIWIEQLPR
jgi:hypothetical protein